MLEPQYFRDNRGKGLSIKGEDTAIEARVVEVTEMEVLDDQQRPRFSVILEGPLEPLLDQQICEFAFPDGQTHSLFMVPLGPKGEAMRYELVFT